MFLLGRQLPDSQKVSIALTAFYGLSHTLASRLCARLQLHEAAKVGELTDGQVTQMSAYLSSPGSIPAQQGKITRSPLIGQKGKETSTSTSSSASSSSSSSSSSTSLPPSQRASPSSDPLRSLLLESDLRRAMQANIAHHRNVGSYKGKRHQQGLPVRGQRTSSNGLTARKLNRIERRGYASLVGSSR
ncbi:S13-like H2TH domain-containing protein [Microstroma glucosiphilum]|uniref:S13-like H2TH domain-containing protein n=1 Tax=Pseudomicrostroma glucosiphilum TaxID=1684307 RepID=A0A316U153_9BASI|nr:S13-like H2TH domain-containing protein [Pseudomicrostroma glucosiphilum]PWN19119.1 S13-like H2TH domain-containing protein [Pseudomicrostroma glucosiphilum]